MAEKIKILYVDEAFGFGGATTCMAALVRSLDRTRFEPLVVLSYRDDENQIRGRYFPDTRVIALPRPYISTHSPKPASFRRRLRWSGIVGDKAFVGAVSMYNVVADFVPRIWRLYRLIRQLRIRVVHANNSLRLNQATVFASMLARAPCVSHIRGFSKVSRLSRWLFQRVETVVVQSYSQKEYLVGQGLDGRRIQVIHEGLSSSELAPSKNGRRLRQSFGFEDDTPLYGIMGMLVPWKGHKIFLEAASIVAKRVPEARALIIGDTITADDDYGAHLRAMAKDLGLDERVLFLGLLTETDDVYSALDVAVHTSVKPEPFGRVLIEAMAHSKAVIATQGAGPEEIVVDGKTGLLVPPGNAEALAEAIITLLTGCELRRSMGDAGYDRVRKHFTSEAQARKMEEIYEQILNSSSVSILDESR